MPRPVTEETLSVRARLLDFIQTYVNQNGYPPTLREISTEVGKGTTGTWFHIKWLVKQGYLTRVDKLSRTFRVTETGAQFATNHRSEPTTK